jgi:hypothetical protein
VRDGRFSPDKLTRVDRELIAEITTVQVVSAEESAAPASTWPLGHALSRD